MLSIPPLSSVFTISYPDFWVLCQLFHFSRVKVTFHGATTLVISLKPVLVPLAQLPRPSPLEARTSETWTIVTIPYGPLGEESSE